MCSQLGRRTVAVVPAYNEGPRIAQVLQVLVAYGFDEVIVVDDGSTDETATIVAGFPVTQVWHGRNLGKGRAMSIGAACSDAEVIFFCDADVSGLTRELIDATLEPVLAGRVDMAIAVRQHTYLTRRAFGMMPLLSGERALTRELWEQVPNRFKARFMIETALNFYASRGRGYEHQVFGTSQVRKEVKYGVVKGAVARVGMFYDILKAQVLLRLSAKKM